MDFTNMSPLEHNMTIESTSHAVVGATPTFKGESKTLSVMLKPGTYKFYCSVPRSPHGGNGRHFGCEVTEKEARAPTLGPSIR